MSIRESPSAFARLSRRWHDLTSLVRWFRPSTGSFTPLCARRRSSRRRSKGTRATLIDLLTFEAQNEAAPGADVEEVCNYIDALSYARAELAMADGLPISMRLLNEAHRRLMHGARGANTQPGE